MNNDKLSMDFVPGSPELAFNIAGKGQPIIFLHGIGGNKDNWDRQIQFFKNSYKAIAWDARGYGDSADYNAPLQFVDFSSDLLRLLDHLEVQKAHLCGLSMGGRIILDFYERHANRVSSLILVDTFPGFGSSFTKEGRDRFVKERRQPLVEEGKEPADIAPDVVPGLLASDAPKAVVQEVITSMGRLHKESYIKSIEALTLYEPITDVSKITVPVQIIVGEEDKLTPPSISEKMHSQIKDSRLKVIPKAGHLTNIEQPELFNECLASFLIEFRS